MSPPDGNEGRRRHGTYAVRLTLCGVRGSTPAPGSDFARYGGHTSCVAVAHGDSPPRLILDAGTGIRRVSDVLAQAAFDGVILLTHLHWDHLQGLPFFAAADHPDARVTVGVPTQPSLDTRGRAGGLATAAAIAKMMSPPHFPIDPAGLRGDWQFVDLDEGWHRIAGLAVFAAEVPHKGGRTYGYRITDGTTTIAYVPDHSPVALGEGPEGLGAYHPAICALVDGVDVLLHDAQHLRTEYASQRPFGHATVEYAIGLARHCAVRRLLLFHHDPARDDDQLDAIRNTYRHTTRPLIDVAAETAVIDPRA